MTISILFGGLFFSLKYTSPHKDHPHQQQQPHHQQKHEKQIMEHDGQHDLTPVDGDKKEANLILLGLTTLDFLIRSYMTVCVYSIYVKFKAERIETDFMNGSDKQRLSYGSGTGSMDKMTDNCSVINER